MSPSTDTSGKRAEVNANKRSGDCVSEDAISSSAQAQTLFVALRNVIIPLIQTNLPDQQDLDEVPIGPEAEDLLIALQRYIASVIRDRSQSDSKERDSSTDLDNNIELSHKSMAASGNPSSQEKGSTAVVHSVGAPSNLQQSELLTTMLGALRQHVFDTMPIRLLHFGMYQSQFEITLVEREEIYTDLAKQLQAEFNESTYSKNINMIRSTAVARIARYSILSHTWLRGAAGEITYNDWLKGDYNTEQPGYQKLANFCKAAADHGFTYGWMDTICINKASSAELDESIRSMYKWYSNANICIIYLAATTDVSAMDIDPWFTRGWTLQELIAPEYVKFYDMNWNRLVNDSPNDKKNHVILQKIESATMISRRDMAHPESVAISKKMQWAAQREVTRGEDTAYSLIGIFNVNISIAYGEGSEQAFSRLLKEILNATKDNIIDIFNWAGKYETNSSSLLPSSPKAYLHRYPDRLEDMRRPVEPLTLTHLGLRIPVLVLPATPTNHPGLPYDCTGSLYGTVNIEPSTPPRMRIPSCYNLLAREVSLGPPYRTNTRGTTIVFAVLNFEVYEDRAAIAIPITCLAIAIIGRCSVTYDHFNQKIPTEKPIIFKLAEIGHSVSNTKMSFIVERKKLAHHGIQQLNMIL